MSMVHPRTLKAWVCRDLPLITSSSCDNILGPSKKWPRQWGLLKGMNLRDFGSGIKRAWLILRLGKWVRLSSSSTPYTKQSTGHDSLTVTTALHTNKVPLSSEQPLKWCTRCLFSSWGYWNLKKMNNLAKSVHLVSSVGGKMFWFQVYLIPKSFFYNRNLWKNFRTCHFYMWPFRGLGSNRFFSNVNSWIFIFLNRSKIF